MPRGMLRVGGLVPAELALAAAPLFSECKGRKKNRFPSAERCPLIHCCCRKKFVIAHSCKGLLLCLLLGRDAGTAPVLRTLIF